jgi:hypothetical protein
MMLDGLSHADALRFIDESETRRVPILGFEWFRRDGDTVTPLGVADFSEASPDTTWQEARSLLSDGIPDGGSMVEFVTGPPL